MKRRSGALAVAVAAGCVILISGCAGCGSTKNIAALNSNWYSNTSYKKIQPTFVEGNDNYSPEIITYNVAQDISTEINNNYTVRYSGGTYKTTFYATAFDKSVYTASEYSDSYPDNLTVYYYKTELEIDSVTFKVGNDEKTFKGDSIVTECYFMPVSDYLRPLYSHEVIKSVSPAGVSAKNLESAYIERDYEYTSFYSYDGEFVKTIYNDGSGTTEKPVVQLSKAKNLVFDSASINIVVRANRLSDSLSQSIGVYAASGNLQDYAIRGGEVALGTERLKIESELKENGLFVPEKDDEGNDKELKTIAVGLTYTGDLTGVSPIYWFTAIENNKNNRGCATMVKMSVPVAFGHGTLNYTLDKIESTIYR